jgi:hypothetical protein
MAEYLLSVHGSEGGNYATPEDMERAFHDVNAFNAELQKSGAWVFAGGLMPASTAKVVRNDGGQLMETDGPYLESKEHIGGFWIINVPDEATALEWAKKGSIACQGSVEVRPFQGIPEQ